MSVRGLPVIRITEGKNEIYHGFRDVTILHDSKSFNLVE